MPTINLLPWREELRKQRQQNFAVAAVAELDKQIEAIAGLERQKERLLARMEIIQQLQRTRPESVYLFDQMVRVLPDGVFFESVTQQGRRLEFEGIAESSTRVSALMRNIESSPWLQDPGLEVVETNEEGGVRRSRFTVSARQIEVSEDEEPTS